MAREKQAKLKKSLGFSKERTLRDQGFKRICGVDEAGRGPWAGPVVAACCIVPIDLELQGVIDSKQTTEEDRELLFEQITSHPDIEYAVSIQSHKVIDDINILQAAMLAMSDSVRKLKAYPDAILVDGPRLPSQLESNVYAEAIVKGDSKVFSIAAASIIAKVTRDRLMVEFGAKYPEYQFERHKGYGTAAHLSALSKLGPTPIHRMTFKPLHRFLSKEQLAALEAKKEKTKAARIAANRSQKKAVKAKSPRSSKRKGVKDSPTSKKRAYSTLAEIPASLNDAPVSARTRSARMCCSA